MSWPAQNENGNNVTANTTVGDGKMFISSLTGKRLPYNKTINEHSSEQLHASTSLISNQYNIDNPLQRRSNDNNPLIHTYRSGDKSTQEKTCGSCENWKIILSRVEGRLKQLSHEVEQICEFINRESKSEKHGYIYKIYKYVSQKLTLSNNTEDSTWTKLLEISEFIKTIQQHFNQQENVILQQDRDIARFQKQIEELKTNLNSLKARKDTKIEELNKQMVGLKEIHDKEIDNRDNTLLFWQDKFDMKVKQCTDLRKGMLELNEKFNKRVTAMQGIINEKVIKLTNYSNNLDITSNNLRLETTHRERLQEELKRIQKMVITKENAFGKEKEKFQENLSKKIKLLGDYNEEISLDDVAVQVENQFVVQTTEIIDKVKDEAVKYEEQVVNFSGNRGDKSYLHIREMLVRTLEKLDAVESQNNEEIQTTRKNSIIYVKELQAKLDKKAKANVAYC